MARGEHGVAPFEGAVAQDEAVSVSPGSALLATRAASTVAMTQNRSLIPVSCNTFDTARWGAARLNATSRV